MTDRSNAFTPCKTCDGHGFLRSGDFASRRFGPCAACGGCGLVYLDPIPPPPAEPKPAAFPCARCGYTHPPAGWVEF